MRITGCRTLTTVHDWGRPVGDANGVFHDGRVAVHLILVDTDEGITGVGLGSDLGLSSVFAAIEGEDPRATVALYDRMLRHVFKAGHAGAVFGTIGALDSALWDIKAKAAGQPLWRLLGGLDRVVPAYASGLDIALSEDELAAVYRTYAERGLRVAKLKGGLDVEPGPGPADPGPRRARRRQPRPAAGPDARRQRGVDPQAGGPARGGAGADPGPDLGRGAGPPLGRRRHGRGGSRGPGVGRCG